MKKSSYLKFDVRAMLYNFLIGEGEDYAIDCTTYKMAGTAKVCEHYLRGRCHYGDKCRFVHPTDQTKRAGRPLHEFIIS